MGPGGGHPHGHTSRRPPGHPPAPRPPGGGAGLPLIHGFRFRPSTGRTGSCFDTAVTAEEALFGYIEGFCNPWRRHSANGQLSPAEYERRHAAKTPQSVLYAAA
ncbi:IS3 family transposase [Streptomyces sp. NPDC052013]|uniref:IS3 family transposase n=1 Tax=Streptomyces sp. NPDC052013 TaxID=3365679 RepID=UPI0037CD3DF4